MNWEHLKLGFAGAATALLAVLAMLFLAQGAVAEPITNETVDLTNESETIGVDVDYGPNASANNVSATVTVLDADGNEVDNASIAGTDGTIASHSFNVTDWSTGTYTVEVTASSPDTNVTASDHIESTTIGVTPSSTDGGGGGAIFDGSRGQKIGLGLGVLAVAFFMMRD